MSNLNQGIPQYGSPFIDQNGNIALVWYQFLVSLFNRTGGSSGTGFAPQNAYYLVSAANSQLPNGEIPINTPTITWDFGTANEARANVELTAIVIPESQVENLVTDLGNRALTSTQIIAGTGLSGSGNLGSNTTLSLNATTATAALNTFTSTLQGLVAGSGGGTTNFLRADDTWHNPLLGGISGTVALAKLTVGGTNGSITYTNGLITSVTAPT